VADWATAGFGGDCIIYVLLVPEDKYQLSLGADRSRAPLQAFGRCDVCNLTDLRLLRSEVSWLDISRTVFPFR
jgi:hypothetical protein